MRTLQSQATAHAELTKGSELQRVGPVGLLSPEWLDLKLIGFVVAITAILFLPACSINVKKNAEGEDKKVDIRSEAHDRIRLLCEEGNASMQFPSATPSSSAPFRG